jgi:predicted ABC-type ATPase
VALTVQAKLEFSRDYYPIFLLIIFEYVNADARPECPNSLLSQLHILAERLMIQRLRTLSDSGADFAFETTLAPHNFARFLRNCKTKGYTIHLMQVLAAISRTRN